jgi:hypothetical protein
MPFLTGYPNSLQSIPDFSLAKHRKWEWLSRAQTRYRETIEEWKDTENNFYVNNSPNDDLESEFRKTIGDAL